MSNSIDVLIIGAGPAGSVAAGLLSRGGLRTLVLEGATFPRFHIGESLLSSSMPMLQDFGVLDSLMAGEFTKKYGASLVWGRTTAQWDLEMPGPREAFQVDRSIFDAMLAARAVELGATIEYGVWVDELLFNEHGRVVGAKTRPGKGQVGSREIYARYVIDASGLNTFVARQLKLDMGASARNEIAIGSRYTGTNLLGDGRQGNLASEASQDGWLWFIPIGPSQTSVGFVGDAESLRGSPLATLRRQIDSTKWFKDLVGDGVRSDGPRMNRYSNHLVAERFWARGYILVGDAAFFVDPLLSTGVHSALKAAYSAASALLSVHNNEVDDGLAANWYDDTMRNHARRLRSTVAIMYSLHPGRSQFWQRRNLSGLTPDAASAMSQALGYSRRAFFLGLEDRKVVDLNPHLSSAFRLANPQPAGSEIVEHNWAFRDGHGYRQALRADGTRLVPVLKFGRLDDTDQDIEVGMSESLKDLFADGTKSSSVPDLPPEHRDLISHLASCGIVTSRPVGNKSRTGSRWG